MCDDTHRLDHQQVGQVCSGRDECCASVVWKVNEIVCGEHSGRWWGWVVAEEVGVGVREGMGKQSFFAEALHFKIRKI